MLNKEFLNDILQNKNFVMFMTSLVFMSGILSCFYYYGIFFASLFTVVFIVLLWCKIFTVKRVLFLIFVFYSGFFLTFFKIKNYDDLLPLTPFNGVLTGRIVSIPDDFGDSKARFFLEVEKAGDNSVNAKTLVNISADEAKLSKLNIGEKISIKGNLRKPFHSTNPSQFDYSAYLRNYNVFTVLYVNDGNFEVLSDDIGLRWKFMRGLNNTRKRVLKTHSKYLKSPNLEILGGIVFGDDAVSPPNYIKNSFVNSGLLHILAASGMNVAFIYTFWFFILRFLKVPFKPRVISGMIMIILYTLMTGLGPSVIRASLMLLFVVAGKLIDRDAHSISLLAFVAVLMLIYNPAYINDVGFQLSFLVTFGLLTSANIISGKLSKIPEWIKVPVIIPIVAQIWVAPVQMFYFNTFSLYSVFANISTVSLLSVISFGGFVSSVLAVIEPIANMVCAVFDFVLKYLLDLLVWISDFFGNLPNCMIQTAHPEIFILILYYTALLIVTYLIKYNKYKAFVITLISSAIIIGTASIRPVSHDLQVIAFDVGNADSFLIKTPKDKYFFIDTGKLAYKSTNSQAKIIMLKYLKDRGIKNIEGLIVTHFDNDHSGGTAEFIENTHIKTLYLNNSGHSTKTAENIFRVIKKTKQNTKYVKNNETIYTEPDLTLKTFKADIGGKNSANLSSTITLLSYKDFDMLFMGDAGVESFNKVKTNIPNKVEVLKVGHHGGPYVVDENMLKHLNSEVALISTGVNMFGHPNKGTLDLLRNTIVLRTDLLNSVKIATDGETYKIFSYDTHDKKYNLKEKIYTIK